MKAVEFLALTSPKVKRIDREGPIHKAILQYLRFVYPRAAIHHSPNEFDMAGRKIARQIAKARNLGTRKGWPDIEMLYEGTFYTFEVKAKGNYALPEQKQCGEDIQASGGYWAVVRSVDDVESCMKAWQGD